MVRTTREEKSVEGASEGNGYHKEKINVEGQNATETLSSLKENEVKLLQKLLSSVELTKVIDRRILANYTEQEFRFEKRVEMRP